MEKSQVKVIEPFSLVECDVESCVLLDNHPVVHMLADPSFDAYLCCFMGNWTIYAEPAECVGKDTVLNCFVCLCMCAGNRTLKRHKSGTARSETRKLSRQL